MICFTCGEREIWSNIKKSQIIKTMIACKVCFAFYVFINNSNSHILAEIYFIFLRKVLDQTWKAFNTKIGPQWQDQKSSFCLQISSSSFMWKLLKVLELTKLSSKSILKEPGTACK